MRVLLINQNPVVKKLVELACTKLNIQVSSVSSLGVGADLSECVCVICDDDSIGSDLDSLRQVQDRGVNVCMLYKKSNASSSHGFKMSVQKPFLPTEVLEVVNQSLQRDTKDSRKSVASDSLSDTVGNIVSDDQMLPDLGSDPDIGQAVSGGSESSPVSQAGDDGIGDLESLLSSQLDVSDPPPTPKSNDSEAEGIDLNNLDSIDFDANAGLESEADELGGPSRLDVGAISSPSADPGFRVDDDHTPDVLATSESELDSDFDNSEDLLDSGHDTSSSDLDLSSELLVDVVDTPSDIVHSVGASPHSSDVDDPVFEDMDSRSDRESLSWSHDDVGGDSGVDVLSSPSLSTTSPDGVSDGWSSSSDDSDDLDASSGSVLLESDLEPVDSEVPTRSVPDIDIAGDLGGDLSAAADPSEPVSMQDFAGVVDPAVGDLGLDLLVDGDQVDEVDEVEATSSTSGDLRDSGAASTDFSDSDFEFDLESDFKPDADGNVGGIDLSRLFGEVQDERDGPSLSIDTDGAADLNPSLSDHELLGADEVGCSEGGANSRYGSIGSVDELEIAEVLGEGCNPIDLDSVIHEIDVSLDSGVGLSDDLLSNEIHVDSELDLAGSDVGSAKFPIESFLVDESDVGVAPVSKDMDFFDNSSKENMLVQLLSSLPSEKIRQVFDGAEIKISFSFKKDS